MRSKSAERFPGPKRVTERSESVTFWNKPSGPNVEFHIEQRPQPPQNIEQRPQPPQNNCLFDHAWLMVLFIKLNLASVGHWLRDKITAFSRYVWDRKAVIAILLAPALLYLSYVYMSESVLLEPTRYQTALIHGPTGVEWQDIQQCQLEIASLKNDYMVLNDEIQPVRNVLEGMKAEIQNIMKIAQDAAHNAIQQAIDYQRVMGVVTKKEVDGIVKDAIKALQEDNVRVADYALKSSGASIVKSRTSKSYESDSAQMHWHNFFVWNYSPNPDVVLEPDVNPGNCWAFPGSQGQILVKLAEKIRPAAVTLQHIARAISPPGKISSAPKEFAVYGLTEETEEVGTFLGQFTYSNEGEPIQTFKLAEENTTPFKYIQLRVLSNWGNSDYTCIYRVRVHRELPSQAEQTTHSVPISA